MVRWERSTGWSTLGVVLASSVVVMSTPQMASALPSVCTSGAANIRAWNHSGATTENFSDTGLWQPQGVPGSNPGEILCIQTNDTLVFDTSGSTSSVHADQIHIAGTVTVDVQGGAQLFADGSAASIWAPGTRVQVTEGQVGGLGTIVAQGDVTLGSPTSLVELTSQDPANGLQPPPDPGEMVVQGRATVADLGAGIRTGYTLTVANGGSVSVAPGSSIWADDGTALTVQPGGLLDLTGDGGYYRGSDVSGLTRSVVTNNGTLRKDGGTGTSVVDAKFLGAGPVVVRSGTLALPDSRKVGAAVSPGASLATGRCDGGSGGACLPTTDPAKDAMSLSFLVPGTNGAPASVQLEERGANIDANQIGNEVLAHADNLVPDAAHPAQLALRYSQPEVMSAPVNEVQVVHTTDDGHDVLLPDCVGGALPPGLWSCVVRPVTRTAQNTFVTVLTTVTSRWRLRRSLPIESQGAATAPQRLTVKEEAPFDGSTLAVSWSAPASSGAGPVTSYRVGLDGNTIATSVGTSARVKNPGPGKHTITVVAINAAGQSAAAAANLTVDALSKPRQVTGVRGAPGGVLTAGARWKPPAAAGGLAITKYKVAVYTKGGRKVDTQVVRAGKLKYLFMLKKGRYYLKVKARNADRWGPWSKRTDLVRSR